MVYTCHYGIMLKEIPGIMIIKYDTPSSFKHDFDFTADNNHTVNCFLQL